jgi:hypothetical protein
MKRIFGKIELVLISVLFVTAASPAFAARKCSADCQNGGGTVKCSRGSTANCGCSSIGTFEASCHRDRIVALDDFSPQAVAPSAAGVNSRRLASAQTIENATDFELTLSEEQIQNLRATSKALRLRGCQHEELAAALDALASSRSTNDLRAAEERVRNTLANSSRETRGIFSALLADSP